MKLRHRRFAIGTVSASALAASLLALGGCPAQQQPAGNQNGDNNSGSAPQTPPGLVGTLDRPISPPADATGGSATTGRETSPGSAAGGGSSALYFTVDDPGGNVLLRPGAAVETRYTLRDLNGDTQSLELVLARDANADGAADGEPVWSMFIVFGRPTGPEGDYLLEQLALDAGAPERLNGVLVKGTVPGDSLGRAVADAGDFNGDGLADVILGHDAAGGGAGEAILLFGSPSLLSPGPNDVGGSPGGGWTFDSIPETRAIRFMGASPGDFAGANVAAAGDVDGDGFDDILIAAPGAEGGRGAVYLIYGSSQLAGTVQLADLTPRNLAVPFAKFIGRAVGDGLGGGAKVVNGTDPGGGSTLAYGQGLAPLGDVDGDGVADFAISSMLADPGGKVDGGEVYLLYGQRGS